MNMVMVKLEPVEHMEETVAVVVALMEMAGELLIMEVVEVDFMEMVVGIILELHL